MKTVLVFNIPRRPCAIWQYGWNFARTLVRNKSKRFSVVYHEAADGRKAVEVLSFCNPDVVIYNWHPAHHDWMDGGPVVRHSELKNLVMAHESVFDVGNYDGALYTSLGFSPPDERWHRLPLLLPEWEFEHAGHKAGPRPVIGVTGFGGAYADQVVEAALNEFPAALIRMHLPLAHYGDQDGNLTRAMVMKCTDMIRGNTNVEMEVTHDFMEQEQLLDWMHNNDVNCFLRKTNQPWEGVSASMCAALAVRRPIAITRTPCFRHLWECQPSVCVEDRSLRQILDNGIAPLQSVYQANTRERFAQVVGEVIEKITDEQP